MSLRIPTLSPDPTAPFPDPESALRRPDGLLAMGGDLQPGRLLTAYRSGIFPWYSEGQPILWWSPDPRLVFRTDGVHLSRRFRRQLRGCDWELRADHDFASVISACAAAPRPGQDGTWITDEMMAAYLALHASGHAHSLEVYAGPRLVGGIYGVAIGRMFFGESMFSAEPGGSKAALAGLAALLRGWGWPLIDAQVENPHLVRMGAVALPRRQFRARIEALCSEDGAPGPWFGRVARFSASSLAG